MRSNAHASGTLEHMLVTAEVRQLGFHDLRRSHASLLAHAGVSTAVTQKLMRHSDPKLTERVYTPVDVETLRREVERLNFKPLLTRLLPERSENAPQEEFGSRAQGKASRLQRLG
jgi:integrase